MSAREDARDRMVFSMLIGTHASAGSNSEPHSTTRRIPVHVSTPQPGAVVVVPRDSMSVLVQTTDTCSESVSIKKPDCAALVCMRRAADVCSLSTNAVAVVHDTKTNAIVQYDVPRESFRNFAQWQTKHGVNTFEVTGITSDAVLHLLSRSVGSFLGSGTPPSKKFAQYFTLSLYSHLAERYGAQCQASERASGGFSPRNQRLVEQELLASSGLNISMEVLSARCRLSSRQFARAFQKNFGVPFYQFQLGLRVQQAKLLLTRAEFPLKTIADQLGYADQATFTESFTRVVGVPPGRYRRQHVGADE